MSCDACGHARKAHEVVTPAGVTWAECCECDCEGFEPAHRSGEQVCMLCALPLPADCTGEICEDCATDAGSGESGCEIERVGRTMLLVDSLSDLVEGRSPNNNNTNGPTGDV